MFTIRKASTLAARPHGYPGRHPGLLLNGIGLVALTPVVSAIQYIATQHLYFRAGAGVLFSGLFVIVLHLLLARRSASRPGVRPRRPTATTFHEKSIPHGALLYAIMGVITLAELVRLGSQLVYYRLGA